MILLFSSRKILGPYVSGPILTALDLRNNSFQINAETTAGGIAHWATSLVAGQLRTNATDYKDAWTPYIQRIAEVTRPNQISNGGPVIGTTSHCWP